MQCLSCRAENRVTNSFCEACETSLQLKCGSCGHANRADSRFCGHCGSALVSATAGTLNSDQLLHSLSVSGGEYKLLTVLFADIRNSTGLIEGMDAEAAMHRIQPVLDAMRDAVHRYDGLVNKVQGDGVMALFGAPYPHEDHAVRGCLAALAIQDAISRLDDAKLQIRVGLHTGEVVVQAVNNSLNQTYDAAGVAVHFANRLEQIADGGGILISSATLAAAGPFIEAKSLGPQVLRGISEPTEIFALIGARPAPSSERFRSGRSSSRLSGRKQELAELQRALDGIERGDRTGANVIGVMGEAGLGKSRLCFEFAETCRRHGVRVLETRVLSHGPATPFQPVLELLRNAFSIHPHEPVEVSRPRVLGLLHARGDFGESLPAVLDFLGLNDAATPGAKLDPAVRKHQLLSFFRQFVQARPPDETMLVVVDDLHWIDPASEDFIEALVDAVVGTRTMLLLNFRPGYAATWMQRSHYRTITLGPLPGADVSALLGDLIGTDPSLALVSRNIAERGQGNPFFLEEMVQSLVERGDLEGRRGAYRLKAGLDIIPLPPTVQAVLGARIDRLVEASRRVLQIAAVIGREVPLAILQRVAGLTSDAVADALSQLRRAEMLYQVTPFSEGLHVFRHPLIQEVAYRSLLQARRREIHGSVARAIADQFADRLDEYAALAAYHLERAEQILPAAQAHIRAALWLGAKGPGQTLRSWTRARELLLSLPRSEQSDYLRLMACGQIVNFGWREGLPADDASRYFEEARDLALATGNLRANAMLHIGIGRIIAVRGSADDYVAKASEAIALARQAGDQSLEVMLSAGLCHALRLAGRLREALEVNIAIAGRTDAVSKTHRQMLGFEIEPWLTALRGQLLIMMGRADEARSYLDRVIQMNPDQINLSDHLVPSISYVDIAWAEGDVWLAEFHGERAYSMALRSGNPYLQTYATAAHGLAHLVAGRPGPAIEDLTNAIEFARRRRAGLEYEPRMLADLANAYRLKGDFKAALQTADEAVQTSTSRNTRIAECVARLVRAQTLWASRGNATTIKEELKRVATLIEETGAALYQPLLDDLRASLAGAGATPGVRIVDDMNGDRRGRAGTPCAG
jgi:adenylate cyclase